MICRHIRFHDKFIGTLVATATESGYSVGVAVFNPKDKRPSKRKGRHLAELRSRAGVEFDIATIKNRNVKGLRITNEYILDLHEVVGISPPLKTQKMTDISTLHDILAFELDKFNDRCQLYFKEPETMENGDQCCGGGSCQSGTTSQPVNAAQADAPQTDGCKDPDDCCGQPDNCQK